MPRPGLKRKPAMSEIIYPTRCRIIDEEGQPSVIPGFKRTTPEISKPHIGKEGWANLVKDEHSPFGETVVITLDDGNTLYGFECWWEPVKGAEDE
jgi:hypothetical protein